MSLPSLLFSFKRKLRTVLSTDLSTIKLSIYYTGLRACSRVHAPIERERVNRGINPLYLKDFKCSRTPLFVNTLMMMFMIQNNLTDTQVIRHSEKGTSKVNYTEKLLQLAVQPAPSKKDAPQVSLPIPAGFDLPDPAKILRTAYDLWQPIRDEMPAWVKYMSLRQAHQNGDQSLAPAHKDAEQAYYRACQQCPAFQNYSKVYRRLYPSPQKIDWNEPSHQEVSL